MIGRRGMLGGLAAMAGGRWLGGDPGTGRGSGIRGGLPGPRPDQQYRPIGPQGPVGSSSSFVRARVVVTYGTGETGLFQYSGSPALGNPPEAWAVPPGVTADPYGNTLPASGGFATIGAGFVSQIASGNLTMFGATDLQPALLSGGAGSADLASGLPSVAGTQAQVILQASSATANGKPQVILGGASAAQIIAGVSPPVTPATAEIQGDLALTEQSSAPPTPAGAGVFYVDSTGHLHYKGPLGTDTTLAPP